MCQRQLRKLPFNSLKPEYLRLNYRELVKLAEECVACHTNLASQSVSLIANICFPELYRFRTPATTWGCKHEESTRDKYLQLALHSHTNVKVEDSGLFFSVEYPFIGASPDGLVACDCCGDGNDNGDGVDGIGRDDHHPLLISTTVKRRAEYLQ